jgi:hypothetical protein
MDIIFAFLLGISNFFSSLFVNNVTPQDLNSINSVVVVASSSQANLDKVYIPNEVYIKDDIYVNKKLGFQISLSPFKVNSTTTLEKIFIEEDGTQNERVIFVNKSKEVSNSKNGIIGVSSLKEASITNLDAVKNDHNRQVEWLSDSVVDGERMIEGIPSQGDQFGYIIHKGKLYSIGGDLLIGYGRERLSTLKFID